MRTNRPVIGITTGTVGNQAFPNSPPVIGQQHTYITAIARAGGLPLLIPIINSTVLLKQYFEMCDGLLFAGGNDIQPKVYGATASPYIGETDPHRDQQELQLWQWCVENDLPVLGICRGLQVINVACGGTLYQDIPSELPHSEVHRISPEESGADDYLQLLHHLRIKEKSKLATLLNTTHIAANAFHHQAVQSLGKDLVATAWAEDGIIEGLEMPGRQFMVAVQCHPESLEAAITPEWRRLFDGLIHAAQTNLSAQQPEQAQS